MSTQLVVDTDDKSSNGLVDQLITNHGGSFHSGSGASTNSAALNRLVTFIDTDGADFLTYILSKTGEYDDRTPQSRISFDMTGMTGVTEEMLQELYEAFDVHKRGGVERTVMRELMKSGFSNFGAPCTDKDIDRLFERITPFSIRRRLRNAKECDDIISFDEFCAYFMSWLRL